MGLSAEVKDEKEPFIGQYISRSFEHSISNKFFCYSFLKKKKNEVQPKRSGYDIFQSLTTRFEIPMHLFQSTN